jgi:hypothetical protein
MGKYAIIQVYDCIDSANDVLLINLKLYSFLTTSVDKQKENQWIRCEGNEQSWVGEIMRSTSIEDEFVGLFSNPNNPAMVTIGHEKSMVYGESYIGPFDMSAQERQSCKYHVIKTDYSY